MYGFNLTLVGVLIIKGIVIVLVAVAILIVAWAVLPPTILAVSMLTVALRLVVWPADRLNDVLSSVIVTPAGAFTVNDAT